MRIIGLLLWAGAAMAAPAHSAVTATSDIGFATQSSVEIAAESGAVYALLAMPGRWWSDSHTYSGDFIFLKSRCGPFNSTDGSVLKS